MAWLSNPQLADHIVLLGAFLMLMLVSAAFEIVMVARKRHLTAAWTYGASDVVRTILLVIPAFVQGGLRAVLWGGIAFGAVRVVAMLHWLRREYGADLRPNRALWKYQLAYALPFALAVGIEVLQANLHSYVVASKFDAATFAIYAVGCLQIPLVDLITTSAANVMMVKMAEDGLHEQRGHRARAVAPHDVAPRAAHLPAGRRAAAACRAMSSSRSSPARMSRACRSSWPGR